MAEPESNPRDDPLQVEADVYVGEEMGTLMGFS